MRQPKIQLIDRRAFTFVEVLLVMVVLGILLAVGVPKMGEAQRHGTVRTATQKVQAYLMTARLAAMRRGQPATFHAVGNSIWVTSQTTAGLTETIAPSVPLDSEHGVTLTAGVQTVRFDRRGFTDLNSSKTFRVSRTGYADSVCVSRGGVVGRCGL